MLLDQPERCAQSGGAQPVVLRKLNRWIQPELGFAGGVAAHERAPELLPVRRKRSDSPELEEPLGSFPEHIAVCWSPLMVCLVSV
jgi:hypothetical protein